ncbi:neural cell adhesion molecule 1-like [Mizuhopecten yessoensis]|uniref:neural cell adhesion molecule 1-like n=1 Tax=Mizuhopecten yessoensis TaxID=6573 RepID=UPI000B45DB8A|nr:neural cell adhesion molecule 1-like [Mizuhopecten yessoensis]
MLGSYFVLVTVMTWTIAMATIDNSDVTIISAKITAEVRFDCSRRSDNEVMIWKVSTKSGTKVFNVKDKCDRKANDPIDVRKRCIDDRYGFDLVIKKIIEDDEGIYECAAARPTDVLKKYDFRIERKAFIPEFAYTKDATVMEGNTARLWCNASGFPIPSVLWQVVDIDSNNRESFHDIGIHGKLLQIKNVSRHCSTSYRCVASNELSRTPAEQNIKIRVDFRAMADLDIYSEDYCGTSTDDLGETIKVNTTGDSYVEKSEGSRVSLVCSGSGSPNATIEWLRHYKGQLIKISTLGHGDQIDNTHQLESFVTAVCPSLFIDERRFRLTFQVFDDMFTTYVCRTSNKYGVDEMAMTVKKAM